MENGRSGIGTAAEAPDVFLRDQANYQLLNVFSFAKSRQMMYKVFKNPDAVGTSA